MKKIMGYLYIGVLAFAMVAMWPLEAKAKATCFCKISKDILAGLTAATGVCKDLTEEVDTTYTGPFQQSQTNQQKCNNRCSEISQSYVQNQSVATACCAIGAGNGTNIYTYSAVGVQKYWGVPSVLPYYSTPRLIGTLTHFPGLTQLVCPESWTSNTTGQNGGVTSDGRCKKLVGTIGNITPLPQNGTPIGEWGFTWGNMVIAWGVQANGGAAVAQIIEPTECHF